MKTLSKKQLFVTFVPAVSILAAIASASLFFQKDISLMTRDPLAISELHPLTGFLSNIGILLWCATASICFFVSVISRNGNNRHPFLFFLFSGLLTGYLLFDDLFQFHEDLASRCLGLNEYVIYAILGVVVSIYLVTFRKIILKTNFIALFLSFLLLLSSVVIDAIFEPWFTRIGLNQWVFFLEDGAKWLGVTSWCSYYIETSYQFTVKNIFTPINTVVNRLL